MANTGNSPGSNPKPYYAAGYLLQASPWYLCPYYNNNYYTDAAGNVYYIICGNGPATTAGAGTALATTSVMST